MRKARPMSAQNGANEVSDKEIAAKLAVVEIAIVCLGKLALAGPKARMTVNDQIEMRQALFDCLEVLNDMKEEN